MKTVLQNVKSGEVTVSEVPPPLVQPGTVLVRNVCSLVSAGTERQVMEFSSANPLKKIRLRPDLFRKVLNRAKNEGLLDTYRVVRNLVEQPVQLGYSCAGIVTEVGREISDIRVGQAVACAGLFKATHSEVVSVPRNLVVPVPEGVSLEEAAFTTLGAIAMQGVRLVRPALSEFVAVYGVGLVGMVALQLALAAGCRVLALDIDPHKVKKAESYGARGLVIDEHLVDNLMGLTGGHGVDKVLLCAGTKSNQPIETIPRIIRQKGVLALVGQVGLQIPQRQYQEKEIDIRFSRSYGPGRYDLSYEEGGLDYPYAYVRWTENRNMESVLDLVQRGRLDMAGLVSHRFPIEEALRAYDIIDGRRKEDYLGIIITYGEAGQARPLPAAVDYPSSRPARQGLRLGVVGAGTFAKAILLPALARQEGVSFEAVCSASGVSADLVARKYGAARATSRPEDIFSDPQVDAVVIATRHDTHADYAMQALEGGKAVLVEKPLAVSLEELDRLARLHRRLEEEGRAPLVMVGYNRRFSPLARSLKEVFRGVEEPLAILYRVNAGVVSADWVVDPVQGGGRIIGEVCHFIDFACFLSGSVPLAVSATALQKGQKSVADCLCLNLRLADGSLASILYLANGNSAMPKEYLEVFGGGISAQLHNFRSLKVFGAKAPGKTRYLNQVKGFDEEARAFVQGLQGKGPAPISFAELEATARAAILAQQALAAGRELEL